MYGYYTPVLMLRIFCLYHAYTSRTEQKWFWIIIFLPLFGSLVYLYHTFYSRRNVQNISEELKNTFISNYKLEKLEKQVRHNNSVANRILLGDEHLKSGNYGPALELYQSCLSGIHQDDPENHDRRTGHVIDLQGFAEQRGCEHDREDRDQVDEQTGFRRADTGHADIPA